MKCVACLVLLQYGTFDAGCEQDLQSAYDCVKRLCTKSCISGLSGIIDSRRADSEQQMARAEIMATAALEFYYCKAKEILCKNRAFLEKIVEAYTKKEILLASDIAEIKKSCEIVPVSL